MPRKAKSVQGAKAQAANGEPELQPTLTEEQQAEANKSGPKERDTEGKFAKGNSGGPGNPHARACAKMLEVFRNAISEDEMLQICRMLFLKAVGGDIGAAKIILSYKIGKPLPAPHPDSIDRDEWNHYQNDAIREQEVKLVMNSLPTHTGNDFARVALPIMTAARMNDLGQQLMQGLEKPDEAGEGKRGKGKTKAKEGDPISNGKLNQEPKHSFPSEAPATPNIPPTAAKQQSSTSAKGEKAKTMEAPIPNGKKGKAGKATNQRKKARPHWLQPLAKELQGTERE
jgi:hypothetical protein